MKSFDLELEFCLLTPNGISSGGLEISFKLIFIAVFPYACDNTA